MGGGANTSTPRSRRVHPLDRVARIPRTCIWEITGACNLCCVHCESSCGEKGSEELPLDRMLEVAGELSRLGCRTVDITGGEPLMKQGWARLASRVRDLGMRSTLVTNGTLLDGEALDQALASGVGLIAISIDGLRTTHDATRLRPTPRPGPTPWDQAVAAIRLAVPRVPVKVITQVNRHNLRELPDVRSLLRDLGVSGWQLQLAVPVGRLLDHPDPYVIVPRDLEELTAFIADAAADGLTPRIDSGDNIGYYTEREAAVRCRASGQGMWLGCMAGVRCVAITCQGRVRGCSALPADFDAGDLHHESIEEVWNDAGRFAYSTRFDPGLLEGGCSGCDHGALCRAGCTTMAYWTTGTIHANPYCLLEVRRGACR